VKTRIPRNANTTAFTTLTSVELISFASRVMVIGAVDGSIGTRVVAHGARDVFNFVYGGQTPALKLRNTEPGQHGESVNQVKSANHSLSPRWMGG
jgi:hypothetical protein